MVGQGRDAPDDVRVERDLAVAMRDGTVLRADVYRSAQAHRLGRDEPVILVRTPYGKHSYAELGYMYARRGYVAVFQDVRGQHASEGAWVPFVHEGDDGEDTVAWVRALPGSTGTLGLVGSSYLAFCAWQIAVRRPEGLGAVVSAMSPFDVRSDWVLPGGALALAFCASWALNNVAQTAVASLPDGEELAAEMAGVYADLARLAETGEDEPDGGSAGGGRGALASLPLTELPGLHAERPEVAGWFFDWLRHLDGSREDAASWQPFDLSGRLEDLDVPVLHVGGWYDVFVGAAARGFAETQGDPRTRLVLGPWSHNTWTSVQAERDFGPSAAYAFQQEALTWTDRWLKQVEDPLDDPSRVRWFVMGADQWREGSAWPPPVDVARLALTSDGRLVFGQARPGSVVQQVDPRDPIPAVGGQSCCYAPVSPMGPRDQRRVEARPDVATFTSDPLRVGLEIVGEVTLEVSLTSSTSSTDIVVTLVDVFPDGRAINLTEGIVRIGTPGASQRSIVPGEVRTVRVGLHPTANLFLPGHRIRLDVAGSRFPTYDRNPHNGALSWAAGPGDLVPSEREIHCGGAQPSVLHLPVMR